MLLKRPLLTYIMSLDFGYGLKRSGSVEETTKKSIELIPGLEIYKRNTFGTFIKADAGRCDIEFKSSTLGKEGEVFYEEEDIVGLARKTFNNHFKENNFGDATLLINHIMIEKENNYYRDLIIEELKNLGIKKNCAIPSGETAVMNTLKGIYLGLTSISIDKKGGNYDLTNKVLIPHADGVGTKSLVYHKYDYRFILDALAMNLNDILVAGLNIPVKVFACNNLIIGRGREEEAYDIKRSLNNKCNDRGIKLVTNNVTLMPNFSGVELDMVLTGVYDIDKLKDINIKEGDTIIGVASSGIHSNGLTGARNYAAKLKGNERKEFYEKLAIPTIIYDNAFRSIEDLRINGAVHITGGAFTKLLKVLPNGLSAYINRNHSLKPQELFYKLKKETTNERMYSYFNCGIGLILISDNKDAEDIISKINQAGNKADNIGTVKKGNHNIIIDSMFNEEKVILA